MEGEKKSNKILRPENGKPMKVMSRFKAELSDQNRPSPPSSSLSKSSILGEVKEISSSPQIVKDIISMTANGFPKPLAKQQLHLGNKSLSKSSPEPAAESLKQKEIIPKQKETIQDLDQEISDQNMKEILSMSAEEVQASISQLSTMFSSENLDFLRSRGGSQSSVASSLKKRPQDSISIEPKVTETKSYIAKDTQELLSQVKSAPSHIRRALQWTLDEDEEEKENGEDFPVTDVSGISKSDLSRNSCPPKLTKSPRFDLQGCRIIHSGITKEGKPKISPNEPPTTFHEWREIFQKSFLGRLLPLLELENLIMFCVAQLLDSGFVVEIPVVDGGMQKWIPELEHHEFDQGSPGYNLLETCEVSPSLIDRIISFFSSFCDLKFPPKGKLAIELF